MKSLVFKTTAMSGALLLMAASGAGAQDITAKVPLKQKWNVGKTYQQTVDMAQKTEVSIGPQKQVMLMDMKQELSMAVTQHKNGSDKVVSMKYGRMAMKTTMAGQALLEFDSDKPDAGNPATAGLKAIAGSEIKLIIDAKDEIKKVEGANELMAKAGGGAAMMKEMFSDDAMKALMKQSGLLVPSGKPVGVGDSWPVDIQLPMGQVGNMGVKGKYTFTKMEQIDGHQCAVLDFTGNLGMTLKPEGAEDNAQAKALAALGMKVKDGTMKATTHFDPKAGIARQTSTETKMVMEMKNPQTGEAMTIPTTQTVKTVIKEKK